MPNFLINVPTRGVKGATSGMKKLSGSMMKLSKVAMVGAAGGALALGVAMKKATSAAAEQELQEKKLTQALGKNADALIKQAGALQQSSRFGDEAIIQQQAYLASIGMSEQQIREMIPVTMDLAAATGMSLESAVKNTAKTLSGMTGELGESVGSLRDLSAEELKAGEGINMMRELFKGAAEGEVKTLTGAMDQAKNAIGDASEALGDIIAPLVMAGASMTKDFAEKAEQAFDFAKKIDFGKTFENMKTNMGALQTLIVDSFKLTFKAIPDIFSFAINRVWPLAKKALGVLWEGIKAVSTFLWVPIGIGIQIVIGKVKNFFIGMVNFAKEQFNTLAGLANRFGADIQPMEMSRLIDLEGLSMANSQMVQLLKEGSQDNLDSFAGFQQAQLEIYKNYANQIIETNQETNEVKGEEGNQDPALLSEGQIDKQKELQKQATKAGFKTTKELQKARKMAAVDFGKNLQTMAKEHKSFEQVGKRAAQVQALVDAYASANAAYKAMAGIPIVGPGLAVAAAAAAVGAGLANVKQIEKAQFGMDQVVSQPTMRLAGEAGREQVSNTPLEGPNLEGPQGGSSITLNISAPLVDDTIVDTIIPAINEAVRRGETLVATG